MYLNIHTCVHTKIYTYRGFFDPLLYIVYWPISITWSWRIFDLTFFRAAAFYSHSVSNLHCFRTHWCNLLLWTCEHSKSTTSCSAHSLASHVWFCSLRHQFQRHIVCHGLVIVSHLFIFLRLSFFFLVFTATHYLLPTISLETLPLHAVPFSVFCSGTPFYRLFKSWHPVAIQVTKFLHNFVSGWLLFSLPEDSEVKTQHCTSIFRVDSINKFLNMRWIHSLFTPPSFPESANF